MRHFLWLLASLTVVTVPPAQSEAPKTQPPAALAEPSAHQKLYYFEHRLMPQWTHRSDGAFYADLREGKVERVKNAAEKLVGAAFAEKLTIENIEAPEGVLIELAPPTETTDCFFIFVAKADAGYRYFTFEKTEDLWGEGLQACTGEWTADGVHHNFGFTKEQSREAFLKIVTDLQNGPKTAPGAVTRPPAMLAK